MNILFLHPNFPAQFKRPCIELAKQKKHQIKFICQTHYGRHIDGVEKLILKGKGSHEKTEASSRQEYEKTLYRAEAYRESFELLKQSSWVPDIIIGHSGWGCGLYLKRAFPSVPFIAYLEWWFDPQSDLIQSMKQSEYFHINDQLLDKLWARNMPAAFEITTADYIVAPTSWQMEQLPLSLQKNCHVIHDIVDQTIFFPEPQKLSPTPLITYGTRGMEPMRAFPQFINLLPKLLRKWPQLSVQIAGNDTISYGGVRPKEGSWKKWALKLLEKENLSDRVSWIGELPLKKYASWLKSSWCHIYLSEPFVTSWSFIEALHCQIPMVASNTNATNEFKNLNDNLITADHNNQAEMLEAINVKLRFIGNFKSKGESNAIAEQIKTPPFLKEKSMMGLAGFIADVEAATKV